MARRTYRVGVALLGTAVLALGIVAIPYPGPGWLIVFGGLAILATEFSWAGRALKWFRARYDAWNDWLGRQHWTVRALAYLGTATVVVVTLWLIGALATVGDWIGLEDWTWLRSPLF